MFNPGHYGGGLFFYLSTLPFRGQANVKKEIQVVSSVDFLDAITVVNVTFQRILVQMPKKTGMYSESYSSQ